MAGKESSIESALDKMAAEWANAELSILEYRDTGTFVIKLDEAVLQQLDDHIGKLPLFWCISVCMRDGSFGYHAQLSRHSCWNSYMSVG